MNFVRNPQPSTLVFSKTAGFYCNSPRSIVGGMGIPAKHPRLLAVLNNNAIQFAEALDRLRVSLSASAHLSSKGSAQ